MKKQALTLIAISLVTIALFQITGERDITAPVLLAGIGSTIYFI